MQKLKRHDMDYVWVLVTRCKTSGLTDAITSIREVWTNEGDAMTSLERHKIHTRLDFYHGEPGLMKISLNEEMPL